MGRADDGLPLRVSVAGLSLDFGRLFAGLVWTGSLWALLEPRKLFFWGMLTLFRSLLFCETRAYVAGAGFAVWGLTEFLATIGTLVSG